MAIYKPNQPDPEQSSIEPQPVKYSAHLIRRLREEALRDHSRDQRPRADVTLRRFGRIVVQRGICHEQPGYHLVVLYHCDCGKAGLIRWGDLLRTTRSCGCLKASKSPAHKRQMQVQDALRLMAEKRASAAEQNRGVQHGNTNRIQMANSDRFKSAHVSESGAVMDIDVALEMSQDELNTREVSEQRLSPAAARRMIELDGNTHLLDDDDW